MAAARFYAPDSSLYQVSEVVPVSGQLAVGPKHSIGDLIAHLDHVWRYARAAESGDDVASVCKDLMRELLVVEAAPRGGGRLLTGIGPTV